MRTPVYDFLRNYNTENALRLHMPGHNGKGLLKEFSDICTLDITEIDGAGDFYSDDGIISQSEKNASSLFGAKRTFYSAGGSTLCIQAMLRLTVGEGGRVLVARDCHKAFLNVSALLGLHVDWIYPKRADEKELFGGYDLEDFENALNQKNYDCVYITTVNYYGYIIDTAKIAEICMRYDVPLICDNAHGAHLAFTDDFLHPISAGADACCDSAHKTLPALTGAAYLHTKKEYKALDVKEAMSLFGTTSPSYPIITSLDILNDFLENKCYNMLKALILEISKMKSKLSGQWFFCGDDPLHITIYSALSGVRGYELATILHENGIRCEYYDDFCVVMLFSVINTPSDVKFVEGVLKNIKNPRIYLKRMPYVFEKYPSKTSLRKAMFSECEELKPNLAVDKICGRSVVPCPPAFPLITAGEIITEKCAEILNSFGVKKIKVIPE